MSTEQQTRGVGGSYVIDGDERKLVSRTAQPGEKSKEPAADKNTISHAAEAKAKNTKE